MTTKSRRRRGLALVGAVLAAGLVPAPPAAAAGEETYQLTGTVRTLVVDAGEGADHSAGTQVMSAVEVDGTWHTLPEPVPLEGGSTGTPALVTVSGPAGLTAEEALAGATQDVQVQDAVRPADEVVTPEADGAAEVPGQAQVVSVEPLAATTAQRETAAVTMGAHQLVVLPVHFGSSDGTPDSVLRAMATETAQFWQEQTGGRMSVATDVRSWRQVADPGGCKAGALLDAALAAHGVAGPTSTRHVLVYFPENATCGGWAGMASVGGGAIWVNGAPYSDVVAHELGHNLGLGHANSLTCRAGGARTPLSADCHAEEYADRADVMGIALGRLPGSLNTAFADHLGLAITHRTVSGERSTVSLAPLRQVGARRAVAVESSEGTVFLDYRPQHGRDARVPGWAGVQAHLQVFTYSGVPETYLLDLKADRPYPFSDVELAVGASWDVPGSGVRVTLQGQDGGSATLLLEPSGSPTVVERYIRRVYQDLFEREVDPGGLATWTRALQSGTPRVAVANSITGSTEYRSRLITGSYRTFLDRAPDAAGLQYWLAEMRRGRTIQQMEAGFLASDEYYLRAGKDDATWVRTLYRHVLSRTPAASEVSYWVDQSRRHGRYRVSMGFLLSTEYLTTVVDGYYQHLLGRSIDPTGRVHWVRQIQTGTRTEAIIGGIVASDEYYGRG